MARRLDHQLRLALPGIMAPEGLDVLAAATAKRNDSHRRPLEVRLSARLRPLAHCGGQQVAADGSSHGLDDALPGFDHHFLPRAAPGS